MCAVSCDGLLRRRGKRVVAEVDKVDADFVLMRGTARRALGRWPPACSRTPLATSASSFVRRAQTLSIARSRSSSGRAVTSSRPSTSPPPAAHDANAMVRLVDHGAGRRRLSRVQRQLADMDVPTTVDDSTASIETRLVGGPEGDESIGEGADGTTAAVNGRWSLVVLTSDRERRRPTDGRAGHDGHVDRDHRPGPSGHDDGRLESLVRAARDAADAGPHRPDRSCSSGRHDLNDEGALMDRIADYGLVRSLGTGNHGEFFLAVPPRRLGIDAEFVAIKVLDGSRSEDTFRPDQGAASLRRSVVAVPRHAVRRRAGGRHRLLLHGVLPARLARRPGPAAAARRGSPRGGRCCTRHACAARGRDRPPRHQAGQHHAPRGGAKLGDLGLSQVLVPGQTITGLGSALGSIEFIDPSSIRGERASRATDIWALGLTLHHVVSGRRRVRRTA